VARVLAVFLSVSLFGAFMLATLVDRFVFFPDAELVGSPADLALAYEEAWFPAEDGVRLHGWYVPGPRRETLLWSHGNAGNISHRLDNLRLLHDLVGVNVFLYDYRGFGRSAGDPSEEGLYADARGALAYLQGRTDVDRQRIVYFGRSLGSGVAVHLGTVQEAYGMILETPFLSLRDMAGTLLPGPLSGIVPRSFDNAAKIRQITCPKLFIHGDRDEIVPYGQGKGLYEQATPPKAFLTLRGAGHNDTYIVGGRRYFERIAKFIRELPPLD
jgi:fermentation-respiration switch protein FrsA (DUF1100 family)